MHNEDVICFAEDSSGVIYFGTNFGIHKFINGRINYLNSHWKIGNTSLKEIKIINKDIYFPSDLGLVIRKNNET